MLSAIHIVVNFFEDEVIVLVRLQVALRPLVLALLRNPLIDHAGHDLVEITLFSGPLEAERY